VLFLSEKGRKVLSDTAQCLDGEVRSCGFAEGIVDKDWHFSEWKFGQKLLCCFNVL
jgi:hypothetical protein